MSSSTPPGASLPSATSGGSPLDRLLASPVRDNEAALGRFLRQSGVLVEAEGVDWSEIRERGSDYLGSMPVQVAGEPENRVTFYLPQACPTPTIERLLGAVRRACVPLPDKIALEGLAKIAVLCRQKSTDADEQTLQLSAFMERLRDYPADAVQWALHEWPEHNQWHPSWAELKRMILAHCWARVRLRDRLQDALQKRRNSA